jgi:hypothetical protein
VFSSHIHVAQVRFFISSILHRQIGGNYGGKGAGSAGLLQGSGYVSTMGGIGDCKHDATYPGARQFGTVSSRSDGGCDELVK